MTTKAELASALEAFADQFRAQVDAAGAPTSEHAVHFCIALGLQSAWSLTPGAIVFERPNRNRLRTDLWVRHPYDIAIEVKYLRPNPGGSTRPYPQLYGHILSDFNKVAREPATTRLTIVVADHDYLGYIERSGRELLPLRVGDSTLVGLSSVARLSRTAQLSAASHGPWVELSATLVWSRLVGEYSLLAWEVVPCS